MMKTALAAAAPSSWRALDIARLCNGRVVRSGSLAQRIATDSRSMGPGDCFVALHGPHFDGHAFVGDALARGAAGVVVDRTSSADLVPEGAFVVEVPDTLAALQVLAARHRHSHAARLVGITGSCGKTTTKDMLGAVLARAMPTVRSPQSFNNQIGVPLTLFLIEAQTRAAVVEIGTSEPGEIARLARLAAPDVAIVTCVAHAHLSGLGSLDGVAREKASLIAELRPEGLAILNGDDEACRAMVAMTAARTALVRLDREADWFATDARFHGLGTTFLLQGRRPVTIPRLGTHNIYNALFTIAAAVEFGMELDQVLAGLGELPPSSRRLEPRLASGVTVFDDTYNMNPASARAGLSALAGLQGPGRRAVVFGGMLELGDRSVQLHRELGTAVAAAGMDLLLTVGAQALPIVDGAVAQGMPTERVLHVAGIAEALEFLSGWVRPDDRVLCKASRRIGLDQLVDGLLARLRERGCGAFNETCSTRSSKP